MTRLVNLTPHPLHLHGTRDGHPEVLVVAPSGRVARCSETADPDGHVALGGGAHAPSLDVPVVAVGLGAVVDLPDPAPGTVYVVSRLVVDAEPGRADLVAPYDLVRDDQGRVVGARALACARTPQTATPAGDPR